MRTKSRDYFVSNVCRSQKKKRERDRNSWRKGKGIGYNWTLHDAYIFFCFSFFLHLCTLQISRVRSCCDRALCNSNLCAFAHDTPLSIYLTPYVCECVYLPNCRSMPLIELSACLKHLHFIFVKKFEIKVKKKNNCILNVLRCVTWPALNINARHQHIFVPSHPLIELRLVRFFPISYSFARVTS